MTPKLKEGAEQEDEASWSSKAKFYRVELGKLGAFLARPWAATEAHKGGMPASDWPHLFLSLPRWEDVLFSIFLMSSLAYVSARIILKSTRIEDSKNVVLPQPPPDSPQTSFVTVIHVPTPTSDIFLVIRPTPSCTDAPSRYLRHNEDVLVKKANQIVGRIGTALSLSPRATEILEKWAVWGIYMFRASLKLSRKVIGKSQRLAKHRLKMWQARFRARDWRRD